MFHWHDSAAQDRILSVLFFTFLRYDWSMRSQHVARKSLKLFKKISGFSERKEQVSKIILTLIVILYNSTYAYALTLYKPPKKTRKSLFLLQFTSFLSTFLSQGPEKQYQQ